MAIQATQISGRPAVAATYRKGCGAPGKRPSSATTPASRPQATSTATISPSQRPTQLSAGRRPAGAQPTARSVCSDTAISSPPLPEKTPQGHPRITRLVPEFHLVVCIFCITQQNLSYRNQIAAKGDFSLLAPMLAATPHSLYALLIDRDNRKFGQEESRH